MFSWLYRFLHTLLGLPYENDLGRVQIDADRDERFRRMEANGG